MDGPCPGLAVFSESSKGPEEDRWKTPPDRSFDGRNASWPQPGALKLVAQRADAKAETRHKTRRDDPRIVAALLRTCFKAVRARATDAAVSTPAEAALLRANG